MLLISDFSLLFFVSCFGSMLSVKKNFWLIGFITASLVFFISVLTVSTKSNSLPALQSHPLPVSLAQWENTDTQGDYFTSIKTAPVGYLVWSQFPIKIYVEQPTDKLDDSANSARFQQWITEVQKAIAQWQPYLPLQQVTQPELADITIFRLSVDRTAKLNPETGLYDIPRAITAQTTYQFYIEESTNILAHKMTIKISPDLSQVATLAAARHELGHSLGIWGHSDRTSDALYFSQVRNTPQISPRDINTLKKIYQQPTRLGWKINN